MAAVVPRRTALRRPLLAVALVIAAGPSAARSGAAWCAAVSSRRGPNVRRSAAADDARGGLPEAVPAAPEAGRRPVLAAVFAAAAALGCGSAARALVKGNAPPKNYGLGKNYADKADCKSVIDCQEKGSIKESEEFGAAKDISYSKTPSGARYKDMTEGTASAGVAQKDSIVQVKYRVMRSGKRSSDGLSGEASTIFSLGFGEDDGPKNAVLTQKLGEGKFVKAMEEGLVGMSVGGTRRIQVRPENGLGWKKEGKCAAEVAAVGIIAGVPGGGAEQEEACIDDTKLPQPADFGSKRRFSRRFDESLIVEVELVGLGAK